MPGISALVVSSDAVGPLDRQYKMGARRRLGQVAGHIAGHIVAAAEAVDDSRPKDWPDDIPVPSFHTPAKFEVGDPAAHQYFEDEGYCVCVTVHLPDIATPCASATHAAFRHARCVHT